MESDPEAAAESVLEKGLASVRVRAVDSAAAHIKSAEAYRPQRFFTKSSRNIPKKLAKRSGKGWWSCRLWSMKRASSGAKGPEGSRPRP